MMKMKYAVTAALAAVVLAAPSTAQAQTCSAAIFSIAFSQCFNSPINTGGGNVWDANGASLATYLNTNEAAGATWSGVEQNSLGAGTAFSYTADATSGTITFTPLLQPGWFALAFKQATQSAVYTFNSPATVPSMTYDVSGVFNPSGLSNVSLWTGSTTTVPEPSSLAMLGLGLVGLGGAAARRRKA